MSLHHLATLTACAGLLALVLYLIRTAHRTDGPAAHLALLLALLATSLLGWNLASVFDVLSGDPWWARADVAISPWSVPLALHLVLAVVGGERRHRASLVVGYAWFGALSVAVVVLPLVGGPDLGLDRRWALIFGAGFLAVATFMLVLLVRHLAQADTRGERQAARMLLLALGVAVGFGATDLLAALGLAVTPMMGVGSLVVVLLLAAVALRLEVVRHLGTAAVVATGLGFLGIVTYVAAFAVVRTNTALLVLATALATLALAGVLFNVRHALSARRRRVLELATLGSFSAQMAHDLQNPLAALQGAVQFLVEERRRGCDLAAHDALLHLMGQQTRRLGRVVDEYRRMGRVAPLRMPTDLNAVLREVLSMQAYAARAEVEVELKLDPAVGPVPLDADLVARAIENVVRNAYEAMPQGGRLVAATGRLEQSVRVSLRDTGKGMRARVLERASDAFFTTKTRGSGLGLSFARRVVEAHGGRFEIKSRPGRGAEVVLEFVEPAA